MRLSRASESSASSRLVDSRGDAVRSRVPPTRHSGVGSLGATRDKRRGEPATTANVVSTPESRAGRIDRGIEKTRRSGDSRAAPFIEKSERAGRVSAGLGRRARARCNACDRSRSHAPRPASCSAGARRHVPPLFAHGKLIIVITFEPLPLFARCSLAPTYRLLVRREDALLRSTPAAPRFRVFRSFHAQNREISECRRSGITSAASNSSHDVSGYAPLAHGSCPEPSVR